MPTGLTSADVVNAALEQVATQDFITSLTDGSPAAIAANIVYAPTVEFLLREMDPAFARYTLPLSIEGGFTAPAPWTYAYEYPIDCIRLRQVRPPGSGTGSLVDPNDPYPVKANVAFAPVSGALSKVIYSNQVNALGVYTTSLVTEADWDAAFTDAVIRRLANPLTMALSGRPDFARELLQQSGASAMAAEVVDEGNFRRMP